MIKKTLLAAISCALLAGCFDMTQPATPKKRGEARALMFTQCMELAAKMPRQSDDDVSDVVDSCAQQSYYITNYID